ncbi:MAG TPA: hypothetical protein VFN13_08030 [Rudaea sp.]|nr:hypothetical protein [Rudaea sp.]
MEAARAVYPEPLDNVPDNLFGLPSQNDLIREASYLQEHGLAQINVLAFTGQRQLRSIRITARGIDFLADDGGLGAILGVVTVRFDADTLKALLIREVEQSGEPAQVKQKLIDQIKGLPAEGVKVLVTEGLKAALRHLPNAIQWLHSALSGPLS